MRPAIVILCRISEFKVEISSVRDILIKKAEVVKKIPQKLKFMLYMIADGYSQVLKIILKRLKQVMNNNKKVNKNQLFLAFGGDL